MPEGYRSQPEPARTHHAAFELAPFESIEIKYRLAATGAMHFSWRATGEVVWDLHAEPDGAEPGFAESFAAGRSMIDQGYYLARFDGVHGWFFENRGSESVFIELDASGFFTQGVVFRGGYPDDFKVPGG